MRTSGAPTESSMIVAILVIALAIMMVLAGGPVEFLLTLEHMLWAVGETVYQTWHAMVG